MPQFSWLLNICSMHACSRLGLDRLSTSTVFVAVAVAAGCESFLRNQGQVRPFSDVRARVNILLWILVQVGITLMHMPLCHAPCRGRGVRARGRGVIISRFCKLRRIDCVLVYTVRLLTRPHPCLDCSVRAFAPQLAWLLCYQHYSICPSTRLAAVLSAL